MWILPPDIYLFVRPNFTHITYYCSILDTLRRQLFRERKKVVNHWLTSLQTLNKRQKDSLVIWMVWVCWWPKYWRWNGRVPMRRWRRRRGFGANKPFDDAGDLPRFKTVLCFQFGQLELFTEWFKHRPKYNSLFMKSYIFTLIGLI